MDSKKRRSVDSSARERSDLNTQGAEIIRPSFKALSPVPCQETIAHLRLLLQEAEQGELVGLAWIAMYQHKRWDRAQTGETQRNPTWLLGMLHAYCAHIAEELNR